MAGNVYLFNTTSDQLQLILNNTVVSGTMAGVTQSGGYAPTTINLARNPSNGNPETNQFGGSNSLVVSYQAGGGTSVTFDVEIPTGTYPIANDLQLYIFYNMAILEYANSGSSISPSTTSTQVVAGKVLSKKQVAELDARVAKASS